MKKLCILGMLILCLLTSSYFDISEQEFKSLEEKGILRNLGFGNYSSNVVTGKETAVRIAEAVARDLYGDMIDQHLPFTVEELEKDPPEWKLEGTPRRYGIFRTVRGPELHIRKYDGAVTFITFWR